MGGRGASSGTSKQGNAYGSQYHMLYQSGNIKYIKKNKRESETLMETMTEGRIYAVVGGDDVTSVVYFDKNNKRAKQIDLTPPEHNNLLPHVHRGYKHNEYDPKEKRLNLSKKETKMVERVLRTWNNKQNR